MMEVNHWKILRKLEGGKDRKGYVEILTDNQMVVARLERVNKYLESCPQVGMIVKVIWKE